jgi:uncharacterized protein YdeI (YjbR/CyaY-like superfamily)
MGTRDPRIDAYIANAAPFAQPILGYLRDVVHEGCPDVVETMKWSSPFFEHEGTLCMMAAFKEHCRFGFWKGNLVLDGETLGLDVTIGGQGRIAAVSDLPPKRTLLELVKKAAELNAAGVKVAKPRKAATKAAVAVPDDLAAALGRREHAKARAAFDTFSPSHRREYVEWIGEAKTDATRRKRLAQTLEQLAEGKSRHWKYQRA